MAVSTGTHMPLRINRTLAELADRAPPSHCVSTRLTQRTRLFAGETAGKGRWELFIFPSLQIMRYQYQPILLRSITQGHPPHFEVHHRVVRERTNTLCVFVSVLVRRVQLLEQAWNRL